MFAGLIKGAQRATQSEHNNKQSPEISDNHQPQLTPTGRRMRVFLTRRCFGGRSRLTLQASVDDRLFALLPEELAVAAAEEDFGPLLATERAHGTCGAAPHREWTRAARGVVALAPYQQLFDRTSRMGFEGRWIGWSNGAKQPSLC